MANERMREQWTKFGGPAWIANRRIFASAYAPLVDALLEALGPMDRLTVLDVGCGGGRLPRRSSIPVVSQSASTSPNR